MNSSGRVGVAITGGDSREILKRIRRAEEMGIQAAWLTTHAWRRQDGLTLLAAAASETRRILLGTSITPTWTRHPVVLMQQVRVITDLAPGRFRLGIGVSHKGSIETVFGLEYRSPLAHLREFLRIIKALLQEGKANYDGKYYAAHMETGCKLDVPVMAAGLRRRSFELCGAEADGAITWVCPRRYNLQVAIPALQAGARKANRPAPRLIAQLPVCVHDNSAEAVAAMREQMGVYPSFPNYAQMFVDAGFPEAAKTHAWSDRMIDAVLLKGNESQVEKQVREMFHYGIAEVIVSPVLAGPDKIASYRRTMRLVADMSGNMSG